MKWINKGRELEKKAESILKEFGDGRKIYVFGAGKLGEDIRIVLERFEIFAGYVDNDAEKQKSGWNGAGVLSFQEYGKEEERKWLVVAASEKNTEEICRQLAGEGLCRERDFFLYQQFMNEIWPVISFFHYHTLFAELAQICLTERCTLKCRKCAHACFNVPYTAQDPSLESVKESADVFFSKFDLVKEFVLIGGEPFLYKELKSVISYIGRKYRDRMITFAITTNGTILPDDEMTALCDQYEVTFRISDYSDSIPQLKPQYDRLYEKLSGSRSAVWKTDRESSWFDYGFEAFDRGDEISGLIEAFDACRTPCREIRGTRYYYCVMARSAPENLGWEIGKEDYIDLREITDRKILLEFQMGFSEKGYLDMCRFCRGAEAKNFLIPAAEQGE